MPAFMSASHQTKERSASVLIAGGGIGGLAAGLALARAGQAVQVFERAAQPSEHGAGIQLGPNAMRVLQHWGLDRALSPYLVEPEGLEVRSAHSDRVLGRLRLGAAMRQRYGASYGLIHRADLHRVLREALAQTSGSALQFDHAMQAYTMTEEGVDVNFAHGAQVRGDWLLGADGAWSAVRAQLLGDGQPQPTGHLAYRALLPQALVPARWQSQQVTVWLGRGLHVVHYPVRRGECLNVVVLVEGRIAGDLSDWNQAAKAQDLQACLQGHCSALCDLIGLAPSWRLWALSARAPMQGAHQQAQGRVALLGDAAHPMLPYLAQGAAMAIEDAQTLAQVMNGLPGSSDVPERLQLYAQRRWQRNARVQARALRNGRIFHAHGPMAWGRNLAMGVLGESLLRMDWLYGHQSG